MHAAVKHTDLKGAYLGVMHYILKINKEEDKER